MKTEISAANGQRVLALTVFAHALSFFRLRALLEISDQAGSKVTSDDIRWIITVPAIWHDPAKQFMRLAAYQVGRTLRIRILRLLRILFLNSRIIANFKTWNELYFFFIFDSSKYCIYTNIQEPGLKYVGYRQSKVGLLSKVHVNSCS